jgi:two-component system, chemotaxis family, chemotaxis protein CheY
MSVNVLVVDDSDVIRTMILKTMRLADIPLGATFEASNGREALEVLEDNWVDVVLADINMPIMDGIEMIEKIRATDGFSDVPVIVISTEWADSRVARLRELGVEAYLRKPFTPEQVREVITEVASRVTGAEHREVLETVMTRVLGQFAMMYAEAVESDGEAPPDGDLVRAHIAFSGAATGALTLAAPRGLCLQMAANATGMDVDDEYARPRSADAFGEVVNMACGLIATSLEGHRETALSPPEVAAMTRDEWAAMGAGAGTVRFVVEDQPMLAALGLRTRS